MRCKFCKTKAIYTKDHSRFCKDHFKNYYLKKVEKILQMGKIFSKKILIGVSGGKDSAAMTLALKELQEKFKLKLELLCIDLQINDYSSNSLKQVKELSKKLEIKLNIISLTDYKTIPFLKENFMIPICSLCGTIKRYLLNKFAFENNFDYVATGHNLDDEAAFLIQNMLNQEIDYIMRDNPINPSINERKLVGKIKPLYFLTEKENMIYAISNDLPIYHAECPYAGNNSQIKHKENFAKLSKDMPNFKSSLIKTILKIKKYTKKDEQEVHLCNKCGYPTTTETCRFCRLNSD